ncbi:MAG: hypothetical protein JSS82_10240 [Bacteroidetes bacterium]|nr:hypothetical protein [Bacteroidota bacterium]
MSFIQDAEHKNGSDKKMWLSIALVNLSIVAVLGMILRSKILFSIPFLDFKYTLHAHSHFAFGGWVSLALMSLMVYEILPKSSYTKPVYKWLLGGILLNAAGMLASFLVQGYAFFSILFSTLFIFISYALALVFIRDLYRAGINKTVKLLCIGGLCYMVLSSAGPFTLAYLIASKSANAVLYSDSIYTYLHLQYNGFFTLSVFAVFFNRVENTLTRKASRYARIFARTLNMTVLPSMFLCYLWHYPNLAFRIVACLGSTLMILSLVYFFNFLASSRTSYKKMEPHTKRIIALSFVAFSLKMFFQSLTISRAVGDLVFTNRPIIIGFLHLVLLGFISLYLLGHFQLAGLFRNKKLAAGASYIFAISVVINEIILMTQGLGIMLMKSSSIYPVLLWLTSICLFAGSTLLIIARYAPCKMHKTLNKHKAMPIVNAIFSNSK